MTKYARAYVWATGQLDNIGDSLLRRPYLERLRNECAELHVWVKDADSGFLSGMGVAPSDILERSYLRWFWSALGGALRGRAILALNAGEVPVSRKGSLRLASLAVLGGVTRSRGGRVVWLGVGVPPKKSVLAAPYRASARMAKATWARDSDTAAMLPGARVVPDWGFATGTASARWESASSRGYIVISLRGDREHPDDTWMTWLRSQIADLGLRPIVVSQVSRDNERGAALAASLNAELLPFDGGDHADQETAVRAVYRRSQVVVSDRLHVLIVAATEGAVPIGWVTGSRGKIRRHFDAADMTWVGLHEGDPASQMAPIARVIASVDLEARLDAARARIADASLEVL